MYQHDDYSCGLVCAQMVTEAFGSKIHKDLMAFIMNTEQSRGTFQADLVHGLKLLKFSRKVVSLVNKPVSIRQIRSRIASGHLAICCVDANDHWIVLRGIKGNRIYVADPIPKSRKFHSLDSFKSRIVGGSIIFIKPKKEKQNES